MSKELNLEANVFNQAFHDFSKAINNASTLVKRLDTPTSLLDMSYTFVSSALDETTRTAFIDTLVSFQKLITTIEEAMQALNRVTESVPETPELMEALARDLKDLKGKGQKLADIGSKFPQRLIDYLDQLHIVLDNVSVLIDPKA